MSALLFLAWKLLTPSLSEAEKEKLATDAFLRVSDRYFQGELNHFPHQKAGSSYVFEGPIESKAYGKACEDIYRVVVFVSASPLETTAEVRIYMNGGLANYITVNFTYNTMG